MRLLVTRAQPDADILAKELLERAHVPLVYPLLYFQPLEFDHTVAAEAKALIISSGNVLRALTAQNFILPLKHLPVYCVGENTARKTKQAGFAAIHGVAATGYELAHILAHNPPDGRVVHLCGQHQAFDFKGFFAQLGLPFYALSVYAMQACTQMDEWLIAVIMEHELDGVILLSARTAQIFYNLCLKHNLNNEAQALHYYCLSSGISLELANLNPEKIFTAKEPSLHELFKLLD